MTKENLKLTPIDLKVDGRILTDSFNVNGIEWYINKTIEELIELADALIHYKREKVAPEQVCAEIGDVFIQIAVLNSIFDHSATQQMINDKLLRIAVRTERIKTKYTFKTDVGFKPNSGG